MSIQDTLFGLPVIAAADFMNPQFFCSYEAFSVLKKAEQELDELRAENARLREALEACIDAVDNDFIKSKTEDGETEYWVSHDMIKDIAYEALARDEAKQEDE